MKSEECGAEGSFILSLCRKIFIAIRKFNAQTKPDTSSQMEILRRQQIDNRIPGNTVYIQRLMDNGSSVYFHFPFPNYRQVVSAWKTFEITSNTVNLVDLTKI